MNKVILMGRLTRDPELRQTPSGVSVARFSIAVNRRFQREGQTEADFINCVAWRQTGEFITKYFQKGSMIAVTGSIQTSSWEGQDGKRQYSTEVVVEEAYFTGSKAESATSGASSQFAAPVAPVAPQPQAEAPDFGGDDMGGFIVDASEDDLPF